MDSNRFSQREYNRILDTHNAQLLSLSQSESEHLLMQSRASKGQAKNGAYVYLRSGRNMISSRKGSREEYDRILGNFEAKTKAPQDCIRHLESLGFGYRQAQTAVYNYRKRNGLIGT